MSRIGNAPIVIPAGVEVSVSGHMVTVTGPKGVLTLNVDPVISVKMEEGQVLVKRKNDLKRVKALHGLSRNLIANMITGVTNLWTKSLELVGVGFRAQLNGNKLVLNVGYSHPVEVEAPENITFEVADNTKGASGTKIKVSGIDKALVGQVAANLKKVRIPDVYKGKGIRYEGEYIKKKAGKSAKVGAAGAGGAK
ncbi:50S ribosomal protein L6 [Candidatus Daviesbacteria bacterium]|nr:50S ribosomal protein L6 [Candidatus Daviesbacteria bacterium]